MGFPMARRLCEAGFDVHVWNRTQAKALPLQAYGAVVHAEATTAVAGADAVISLLENGTVVHHVLFDLGVAAAMQRGALWIDMASIAPDEARLHAQLLQEQHQLRPLDAPVSGGTVGAEQGTLSIMVGGSAADFDAALPVFAALGRATHVGPAGSGQLAKVANQMIVGTTIGAVAEALLLCAKGGADMGKVREALLGGFADSRILELHGQRMVERDFTRRGGMDIQHKDMRNAMRTAQQLDCTLPIATLIAQLYAEANSHGLEGLDHSALFVELAQRNGLR